MRLFIAINFDNNTKEKLLEIQRKLKSATLSGNFSSPQNLHLTILYLGETNNPTPIIEAIETHFTKPFDLTFKDSGVFKNNIYWVGITPNLTLQELNLKLCDDFRAADIFFDDSHGFNPHITLARDVVLAEETKPQLDFNEFSMHVNRVSLMNSEFLNRKLVYTEIFGKNCDIR